MKARTFVDSVVLYATSGRGGDGVVSFRREKFIPKGGPDGGDGGRGGHVILRASRDVDSLLSLYYTPHQRAKAGNPGGGSRSTGHNGADVILPVPCGTVVTDQTTGEAIGDLVEDGSELIVARGGRGGRGNWHWRSPTHQTPREHTDGAAGEERTLRLELKLVADIGLVGFPNAGKSSLLGRLTRARPKVAAYPFTTLHPIMGTVFFDDFTTTRLVDIPGLIEGAHTGAGLGHDFLRHADRCRALAIVIDMAGIDGRKPFEDYRTLRRELKLYNPALLARPMICVANKMDLPEAAVHLKEFKRKTRLKPLPISTVTGDGLAALIAALKGLLAAPAP